MADSTTNPLLIFTANAANKAWELIQEENKFNLKLRVSISGGGCSGFQYAFTFDEDVNANDTVIEGPGGHPVQLLIDSVSIQYLVGSEIDYQEGLEGEQFVIRNPNAKTTCGCGSSFST